jgi:hypothetical protein
MLTIRDEQFEKLSQWVHENFIDRMLAHLCHDFPEQCTLREVRKVDLRLLIGEAITNAARYGITNESDVRSFIEYSMLLPPEISLLEKVPWVGEILSTC